jgi:NAD(P)-dependent dehydrogenase (short-subunit alcohol dehydrogenase family)
MEGPTMNEAAQGRLAGKVAVVTGASQGIGREIAVAFAEQGAQVVAGARSLAGLKATAARAAGRIIPQVCDVRSERDVEALIKTAVTEFGRLDVMCNNAAVLKTAPLTDTSQEVWDEIIETNLRGTFFGCKHSIPALEATGRGGSIINIGSINSFVGERLHTAYVSSKGGVLMLTKNAAAECSSKGIRVNMIAPGGTDTPMNDAYFDSAESRAAGDASARIFQPLGGLVPPTDVAAAAVFLASSDSSSMTGSTMLVDGGLMAAWDHAVGNVVWRG